MADTMRLAFMKPGLKVFFSKYDVNEAFRLVWLAVHLVGLFAVSIPRHVVGLGLGDFYVLLLALSCSQHTKFGRVWSRMRWC